jgi:hypothetical protein
MPRFMQIHSVYDKATLDLLQRAYSDFCRDGGIEPSPSGRGSASTSTPRYGSMSAQRGHRLVPGVEDTDNLEFAMDERRPTAVSARVTTRRPTMPR